jgi:hypothetical protein
VKVINRPLFFLILVAFWFVYFGCSNVSSNAVDLEIDFSWEGMQRRGMGIPEIRIKEVPNNTKYLKARKGPRRSWG